MVGTDGFTFSDLPPPAQGSFKDFVRSLSSRLCSQLRFPTPVRKPIFVPELGRRLNLTLNFRNQVTLKVIRNIFYAKKALIKRLKGIVQFVAIKKKVSKN